MTDITVREVISLYLQEKKLHHACGMFSAKSMDRAKRRLTAFAAEFGDKNVSTCAQHNITTWVASHPEWESSHTKNDSVGCLVACFRWATQQRLIPYCPFIRPRGLWPALQPRVAISAEEYRLMLDVAKRRGYRRSRLAFRVALFFLWETGARTCEMRELLWEHINFATGMVCLAKNKTLSATGEARLIALTPATWRMAKWTRRRRKDRDNGRVFTNSQGGPWEVGSFAQYFRRVAKAAGIRLAISPYSLRHGFCVQGLENGVGERQMADLMGHTTTRYIAWYGRGTRRKGDYLRGVLDQVHGRKPRNNPPTPQ